jgi:regulator of protease activity HflC (stomatin/prohibitin superfamily)
MKKLLTIVGLVGALLLTGCQEQVEQGHVGKILGKSGFQPEVYPPSRIWVSNSLPWNYDRLIQIETTTKKFGEPITVLLDDKLSLSADIIFRCRITTNPKDLNALFNDIKVSNTTITTEDVYNIYGKMIVTNSARAIISKYNVDEINKNYERITTELYNSIKGKLTGLPIEISDVTLGNIQYPKIVTMAIEQAKEKQMAIEKEEAQVQIELTKAKGAEEIAKANYRIKMLEAKRIRDYDLMIAEGITQSTLRLRELELREKELDKWNGILPTTLMGANTPVIVNQK